MVEVRKIGVGMLGYAFMGKAHTNGFKKLSYIYYPPPAIPVLKGICGRNEEAVKEAILKEKEEPAQEPEAPQVLAESEVEKLVEGTKLPSAFKAALKVAEYADEDALEAAIAEAVKEVKSLTGSGKVFAQGCGEPAKDQPLSEADKAKRFNEIMAAVDGRQVPVPAEQ